MLFGICVSGCAAMVFEIAWIRLLGLVLGSSTYAFPLMLAAFITGLTLGSLLVSLRLFSRFDPYRLFALAEIGVALSVILTLPFYERLPYYFLRFANIEVRVPGTFWLHAALQFGACVLLMLPPTLFFGMTLPLASRITSRRLDDVGKTVGRVFAWNTVGTLVGAALAGLVLLPALGVKGLVELGVTLTLVVGLVVLTRASGWGWRQRVAVGGLAPVLFLVYLVAVPEWDVNVLAGGQFRWRGPYPDESYAEFKNRWQDEQLLYYKDGPNGTVTVVNNEDDDVVLRINGKPDATARADLPTQILVGQIPLALRPTARDVLVIGLGSGITSGTVLGHLIQRLDVVEISDAVVEAASHFVPHNNDVLADPRTRLLVEDARSFLEVTDDTYDVIISEPSNPWVAGMANLFSREFYEEARGHLKPGGVIVQWVQTYELSNDILRLVLRTFADTFPHVSLWRPPAADIILVGSVAPLTLDLDRMDDGFAAAREELGRIDIDNLLTLLSLQAAGTDEVTRAGGVGPLNLDRFPILEYEAARTFFFDMRVTLLSRLDERQRPLAQSALFVREYLEEGSLGPDEFSRAVRYHASHGSAGDAYEWLLNAWVDQYPEDVDGRWAMVEWHDRNGEQDRVDELLLGLVAEGPVAPTYAEQAAELAAEVHVRQRSSADPSLPFETVAALYERALEVSPENQGRIYRKMGSSYRNAQRYPEALAAIDRAIDLQAGDQNPVVPHDALLLQAGLLAMQMRERPRALDYLERALAANPDNATAQRALFAVRRERTGQPSGPSRVLPLISIVIAHFVLDTFSAGSCEMSVMSPYPPL